MYFICHDKHISDNGAYNKDGIGWYEMDYAKGFLTH